MSALPRPRLRFALLPAVLLAGAVGLAAHGRQPETPAPPADPPAKTNGKSEDRPPVVKLPDGTFLWVGEPGDKAGVNLTSQELQKLYDQIDQLKKQLAARRPTPPSSCAVRARVEKRGEQLVAVLRLTCAFRTAQPQSAVALGGRRGFLVSASLDGDKLPVLDTTDDGLAVLAEAAGDHTLVLDLEAPVTARGAKPEVGFEIGLPRAPITTLLFDPPGGDVKRVNLTTRTPDPTKAVPPDPRRTPALDVKQLSARTGAEGGYALGPVDSLEVTWDPPASAQSGEQVQSAELDVAVLLTEGVVESTAKIRLRGPAREWKIVAPANADLSADRVAGTGEVGPTQPASVTKPADPNKPVWKVELPAGSAAADWVVTAVTRPPRPKPEEGRYRGPFPVGPFAVLDVVRQTGTVKVTAGPHTHFAFRHGPDLRRADPGDPPADDVTTAFFRLTTGPTGTTPVSAPLFTIVEARPQDGAVKVRPAYQLTLGEPGWRVRADVRVTPVRTELDALTIEVPADWHGLEASPPELVEGVQQGPPQAGFWEATAARFAGGLRVPVVVLLAGVQKQPFDLVLTATVPVAPGDAAVSVPLPRFPGAIAGGAAVTAAVPEGLEVRGEVRDWGGEYAAWGDTLSPEATPDGKPPRAVTRKTDAGFSRVLLAWHPHRPELVAELRADVTVGDRQVVVVQQIKLRSPEPLPRPLRFRGSVGAVTPADLRTSPPGPALEPTGPGEWTLTPATDSRELALTATFAVPTPPGPDDERTVPVLLLWPAGATRVETTARVWTNATGGRAVGPGSAGWRELPAEPAPDRDALPALTLAASGFEPLALKTRPVADPGRVRAWVDRGLIQAWDADDGATSYRARFLLRRWLVPTVEVRLPGRPVGPSPEFLRDGQRVTAAVLPGGGDERAFRLPLPAARPGETTVIEVRYQSPAGRGRGEASYLAPTLPGVAYAGPVRWHATGQDRTVLLLTAGGEAEFGWRLRPFGLAPAAAASVERLDAWFRSGTDDGGGDGTVEALVVHQPAPGPVTVYRTSRTGFVVASSVAAFVLLLVLSRLPGVAVGPGVAVLGGAAGVAAVAFPHPAAQVAGACQPGVAAAGVVLLSLAAARALYRRNAARAPGFARTVPEAEAAPLPSSARSRPSGIGSAQRAPATPAGG